MDPASHSRLSTGIRLPLLLLESEVSLHPPPLCLVEVLQLEVSLLGLLLLGPLLQLGPAMPFLLLLLNIVLQGVGVGGYVLKSAMTGPIYSDCV